MSAARLRLGGPQVEPGERVEGLAERAGVRGDERRQLVEDPRDLLRPRRPAPRARRCPSSTADQRLDEERLAAARRVVDDALDPRPGLGLDRHDVAAVAERDDRLLERAAQLRADERVQPPAQPVVGDADGRAQAAQPRRGRVEQLPDRVEAARERAAQRRQRVQLAAELAQQRPALVGERRREARGRVERVGDLEELARARAGRRGPPARWPARCRAPRRRRRPAARSAARGPGRSRRGRARRRPGRRTGSSASASRRDGGNEVASASRSRTSGNSSRAIERWSIGGRRARAVSAPSAARTRTGGRRSTNRHGRLAQARPA